MEPESAQLTGLLRAWSSGDSDASQRVLTLVYDRVRQIAAQRMRAAGGGSLQATELAHELVLNLLEAEVDWQDRLHFFKTVNVAMRNLLLDLARRQAAPRHGGDRLRITLRALDEAMAPADDAEELHSALVALRELDPRKADVLEYHYFVGLDLPDVARALQISLPTVNRDLRFARAWIRSRLDA